VEYRRIAFLKKPRNPLLIKKFLVNPSCEDETAVKALPNWIRALRSLQELSLGTDLETADRQDCNLVTSLPTDLRSLKVLKKFVVDDAFGDQGSVLLMKLKMPTSLQIVGLNRVGLRTIPDWVFGQKNLERLTIQYGEISTIPKQISELKALEHLDLSMNAIRSLPKEITQIRTLKFLRLAGNDIGEKQQKEMQALLPKVEFDFGNETTP
jgi:Leucine-rich repeat (LRR) protein